MRLIASLACLLVCACASAPSIEPSRLPAGEWALDPAHASATWRVRHLGLSWYTARFDRLDARLSFDPANPGASELTAVIEAASVSTGDPDFDETLRSAAWFDASRHPQILFRSTRIEVTGETTGRVHGELTLKGVTRPAVLETEFYGGVFNLLEGRRAMGFGADLVIDRSDFGVGRLPPGFIGDEVRVRIEAEFLRTTPE
ncbi:MAG: polyisoprenoid-binding protein [Alphaproteobacteria bacterium]|nr:polyisoprenoid-binding protein [Alphaproteobacteria bacterium]